jgi:MOSC domain-containing protein YiiM
MDVEAVNAGEIRSIELDGRTITTAIWKYPVSGRVAVAGVNVDGDEQADRSVHGGADKAVYAYSLDDTDWWETALERELGPGAFGENLSIRGIDLREALIGERWAVGSTLLEVRQPRIPCFKLGLRMGDPRFLKQFARAERPGLYLAIVEEGDIGAGDAIEVVSRPDHEVTIGLLNHAFLHNRSRLPEVLAAPALPEQWRGWIEASVA